MARPSPSHRFKAEHAINMAVLRANELGYIVSRPLTAGPRYNLLLDTETTERKSPVIRAQVVYADGACKQAKGVVIANLKRQSKGGDRIRLYKRTEVDILLVYVPKIEAVCRFPLDVFEGKNSISIRYEKPKNGQVKKCLMAQDYIW